MKNPCEECIVKSNCSKKCKEFQEYFKLEDHRNKRKLFFWRLKNSSLLLSISSIVAYFLFNIIDKIRDSNGLIVIVSFVFVICILAVCMGAAMLICTFESLGET